MMVLGSFILSNEKIPHTQKAQKVQKATFFILDVFMHTKNKKSTKSTRCQTSGFFFLDVFMRLCAFRAFHAKQTTFFLLDVFMRI